MTPRLLKVTLILLVVISLCAVFILNRLIWARPSGPPVVTQMQVFTESTTVWARPSGPPVVTQIQIFTKSTTVWEDFTICKTFPIPFASKKNRYVRCPSTTLKVTISPFIENLKGQDAVLYNFVEEPHLSQQIPKLVSLSTKKDYRNQVWIFKALESASYMRWMQSPVKSLPVHAIMGYHSSSSIMHIYGHYVHGEPMADLKSNTLQNWMDNKVHLVAWIARNCHNTFWPRLDYVHDLMKHIRVDIYGKCGNLSCLPRISEKCLKVMESYKFFLSLENSECDDYITEKFWNAVKHGVVPIVYGPKKEYYVKIAPPNSFIYAGDFKSVKELAKYLLYLDKNPEEYRKYLEWIYRGRPYNMYIDHCLLCDIPEVIKNVSIGLLEKKPMSDTIYYNSCRPQEGGLEFRTNIGYTRWFPWK